MFSAAQLEPRTGRAILFAILMMLVVQAGYAIVDLVFRKLAAERVSHILIYLIGAALLALGAYVGVAISCSRYPFADRVAILWGAAGVAILAGLLGVVNSVPNVGVLSALAIHALYAAVQILGIWLSVKIHKKPSYLPMG